MKLSFTTMATPNQNAIGAANFAIKYGYDGVDLRVSKERGELTVNSSAQEIKDICNAFSDNGVQISSLFCYNLVADDKMDSWQTMVDSVIKHIEIADRLNVRNIRIFGGNPDNYPNREEYIIKSAEVINNLFDQSGGDFTLLLQNHIGSFNVQDTLKLAHYVDNHMFALAFDPYHSIKMGESNLNNNFEEIRKITEAIYITDYIKNGDEFSFVLPGKGQIDIVSYLSAIGGNDFDGWVTFKWPKIWNRNLAEPEVSLPHFIKYIKQSFNQDFKNDTNSINQR